MTDRPPSTRAIPSTGEALPVIGLGTWRAFDVARGSTAYTRLGEVIGAFAALGGSVVDSSPMYGRAEEVVGDLASALGLRPKLFVATKVWTQGRDAGVRQMQESMRLLRVEQLDLIQVHNLVDARTHLETLAAWKREGKTRYIGVTHYTAAHHDAVEHVITTNAVDFLQINYSVAEREAERSLLPRAQDRGIAVLVNRPFAEGALLRRLRSVAIPSWADAIGCASWAQLLLTFVLSHPAVTCVIPATANPEHLRDNMSVSLERMPDAEMRERIAGAALGNMT